MDVSSADSVQALAAGAERILLTTCPPPYPEHPPDRDGIDQYGMRFTKRQELFQLPIDYPYHLGLHLIARNLAAEVTVLDAPPWPLLAAELARRPRIVGLTFPAVFLHRALEVARLVRRLAPRAHLVLGGHGVACFAAWDDPGEGCAAGQAAPEISPNALTDLHELQGLADQVVSGDGIAPLRQLLGQHPAAPISGVLPPAGVMHPFGLPLISPRSMISLTPTLGCSGGCDFCSTGAFFGGRRRQILTPEQAARAVVTQLTRVPRKQRALGVILDEDLLADRSWLAPFGEMLASDRQVRESGFSCTVVASQRALEQYDATELLRWRISNIWVGVETTLPQTNEPYLERKRRQTQHAFDHLHAAGITTTASFILGWDFHDRDSLAQDLEALVKLRPTMYQIMPLIPAPGTRLWARMAASGRLERLDSFAGLHYYGRGFRYRHFSVEELWGMEDQVEDRLYREQGPSLLKMAEVYLTGWRRFAGHSDPALANMASVQAAMLDELRPVLSSISRFAPSPQVAERARNLDQELSRALGQPSLQQRGQALALLALNALRRRGWIGRPYQPSAHRTVYRHGQAIVADWGRAIASGAARGRPARHT